MILLSETAVDDAVLKAFRDSMELEELFMNQLFMKTFEYISTFVYIKVPLLCLHPFLLLKPPTFSNEKHDLKYKP